MKYHDIVRIAWRQLTQRRLRTALTVLAVSVGVMVIVILSAHTQGMYNSFISTFQKLGPTTIIVMPGGGSRLLSDADVFRLSEVPGVDKVIPLRTLDGVVEGLNVRVTIMGVRSSELQDLLGEVNLISGTVFQDVPAPLALIGYNVAYDPSTGRELVKAGQAIVVRAGRSTLTFGVIGVLDYYGSSVLRTSPDDAILIPLEYFKRLTTVQGYTMVLVKAADVESVNDVVNNINILMGARARVISVQMITTTFSSILSQLNMLLVSIASTAFIAAGLGTLNIMMITVLERTREIGLVKALGMKDSDVLLLYLTQGLMIGVIGGTIGLVLGAVFTYTLPDIFTIATGRGVAGGASMPGMSMAYTPELNVYYSLLAFTLSLTVSLIASIYPSWRAAKLSPVEALRYE